MLLQHGAVEDGAPGAWGQGQGGRYSALTYVSSQRVTRDNIHIIHRYDIEKPSGIGQ